MAAKSSGSQVGTAWGLACMSMLLSLFRNFCQAASTDWRDVLRRFQVWFHEPSCSCMLSMHVPTCASMTCMHVALQVPEEALAKLAEAPIFLNYIYFRYLNAYMFAKLCMHVCVCAGYKCCPSSRTIRVAGEGRGAYMHMHMHACMHACMICFRVCFIYKYAGGRRAKRGATCSS